MSDHSITSLIEKLEGAEGPSIALDAEIFWTLERDRATSAFWRGAMGLPRPLPDEFSRLSRGLGMASLEAGSPNYTASLDAALALAERILGAGWSYSIIGEIGGGSTATLEQPDVDLGNGVVASPGLCGLAEFEGEAATDALALCAALLRAQSEAR